MRAFRILLFAACLCLLSACGREERFSGEVVETGLVDEAGQAAFVVRVGVDGEIGIVMTEETFVFSSLDGMDTEAFRAEPWTEVLVSVDYAPSRGTLTTTEGEEIPAYEARSVQLTGYLREDTALLSDGTQAAIWQYEDGVEYALQNGPELLKVEEPVGPGEVYVRGLTGPADLREPAKERVLQFYREQGILYDVETELERAYTAYLQNKEDFRAHRVSQEIMPTAVSERVIYFMTQVLLPTDKIGIYEDYRLGAAFDRATGEPLELWELFSCPPDEVGERLVALVSGGDPTLRAEMEHAFQPEKVLFFPENLELYFEEGALPSRNCTSLWDLKYNEDLGEILYEWAVPIDQTE